jgi:hypothetical protein
MNVHASGVALVFAGLFACSSSSSAPADGGSTGGNGMAQVGVACTPASELNASFDGFNAAEVFDSSNPACGGGGCLVYHFQGRTSCPYGQDAQGMAPSGATACTVPGTSTAVTGAVQAQCSDRTAAETVYCSCQCADSSGNAGANDCACPTGYDCTQLGAPLGGYCVKAGTTYQDTTACATTCDPQGSPCK